MQSAGGLPDRRVRDQRAFLWSNRLAGRQSSVSSPVGKGAVLAVRLALAVVLPLAVVRVIVGRRQNRRLRRIVVVVFLVP